MGRHVPPVVSAPTNVSGAPRTAQSDDVKVYYLGHDKDGTWAEPRDINDFGAVIAVGDIAGGYTHQMWASLFGRQAGQWFDLGSFGGEDTTGWLFEGGGITDTGMIVGSGGTADGHTHAFVLTFASEAERDAYLPHPKHQEFVQWVGAFVEKALVVDYWARK